MRTAPALLAVILAGAVFLPAAAPAPSPLHGRPAQAARLLPWWQADQVIRQIDNALANHLPRIVSYQDLYRGVRGRYFQALISHSVTPSDGTSRSIDRAEAGPTDQPDRLRALLDGAELPDDLPFAFAVDVYDGPSGHGWVLTIQVSRNGTTVQRSINVGPETWREANWHQLPDTRAVLG